MTSPGQPGVPLRGDREAEAPVQPSILFLRSEDAARAGHAAQPAFFTDLNLDQITDAVTVGRREYDLRPFLHTPLHHPEAVRYRHEVFRDLEQGQVLGAVRRFAEQIRDMRAHLEQAGKLRGKYQIEWWFLRAADTYCRAVTSLASDLDGASIASAGLQAFRQHLAGYVRSDAFTALVSQTAEVHADLATVAYSVHIRGNRVRVSRYAGEPDYSAEVVKSFAKFKQGRVKEYRTGVRDGPDMNQVEARILELVTRLYPRVFEALDRYCSRHQRYLDSVIAAFDREVQFYLAYLEFMAPFSRAGLRFCYPQVSADTKDSSVNDAFDLALAVKLAGGNSPPVVRNGFALHDHERILVVTGPNQGGKTTFARMFGQLHYLASLGCPVPGTSARLFLPDQIFTHFEREEDLATLRGKLDDELTRVHDILRQATDRSVVVMNESFTSTTLDDALFLGTEVMRRMISLDLLCVYVTFVDELASLSGSTVSMVAAIDPDNPAVRTYRVQRRAADGLAYAAAIAGKYGLTYERVTERIA